MAVFPAGGRDLLSSWRSFHQAGRADHAAPPSVRLQPCRVRQTLTTHRGSGCITDIVSVGCDQTLQLTVNYKLNVSLTHMQGG